MALDDLNKLKSYEDTIVDRIADWESESTADIAREIARIGKMSKEEAEKYDAKKAAKERWEKMIAALAVIMVLDAKETKRAFKGNYEDWHEKNKALYKRAGKAYKQPRDDKDLQEDIKDAAKQNVKDALNYTDTKALRILDGNGNAIRGQAAIQKAFTEAVDNVRNGSTDFTQAMRQTIEQLGGGGVRVDYGGGITRRLDTVVRQNLMYGLKKANAEYEDKIAKMLGADGYEIDLHANSRPSHVFMQGKQYCIGKTRKIGDRTFIGFEEVDPESPDGLSANEALNDYGCRHYRTPIICGVSEPRWSDEDIERSKQEHARVIDIDGVSGNKYFWTQKMRAIETDIRRSKDEINALKALGGNDARIRQLQDRIKVFKAKYDQISDATGIDGDAEWKRRMVKFAKSHSGTSGIGDLATRDMANGLRNSAITGETFGKRSNVNANRVPISQRRFDELTIQARKNGANIIMCDYGDDLYHHLEKNGATASCIGNTIIFRADATISEVLEETRHFMQNIECLNNDKPIGIRQILNEIEAGEFILNNAAKYGVPRAELEEIEQNVKMYKEKLKKYSGGE